MGIFRSVAVRAALTMIYVVLLCGPISAFGAEIDGEVECAHVAATAQAANPMASDDRGGSTIYGTVIAFGSVCVNGLKVEYDGETVVETDGRTGHAENLELGRVVRIDTRLDDPNRAARITIESALSGPINRVEPNRRRLFIMGAEVQLREDAVIRDTKSQDQALTALARGDHVGVSGLRRSDGVLMASRIDELPPGAPTFATGVALPIGIDTFYVGRVRGQLAVGTKMDPQLRRARVQIRGTWSERTQTLEDVTMHEAPTHLEGSGEVSIQGYIDADRGHGGFKIADTRVSVSDETGVGHQFHRDARVRVRGHFDQAGRLQANWIVVEERGQEEIVGSSIPITTSPPGEEEPVSDKTTLEGVTRPAEVPLEPGDSVPN